jgi:hypothetical protein
MRGEAEGRRAAGALAAADLAALVRESVAGNVAREVLHLRLSGLRGALRLPHHGRLLRDAFAPALLGARIRVFDLPNGDVVAVAPPPAPALEEAARAVKRTLDLVDDVALARLRLPDAAAALLGTAAESLGLGPRPSPEGPAAPPLELGTTELAAAERALAQADLEPFTRREPVCELDPAGGAPRLLWHDLRPDWDALAAAILPNAEPGTGEGLARRLGRLAEARLLAGIGRAAAGLRWRPVGLALSPGTLLDAGFRRFEAALPAGRRREVVIGLRPADILADPAGFRQACAATRERGFPLALDDAPAALLGILPPDRLGLEILRLRWDAALPVELPCIGNPGLAGRVVLAGADRPAAVAWGWEAGIHRFQGAVPGRARLPATPP